MFTSIRFSINKISYKQIMTWQREINQAILRHQIETRGQALVTRLGDEIGVRKIDTLPEPGQAEPYFGALGGAYRYTFHPLVGGCELEVVNLMGGFAFYYPERFPPLHLFLFDPPEMIETNEDETQDRMLDEELDNLFEHDPQAGTMRFNVSPLLYQTFIDWAWSRRPLHAYDFIFTPNEGGCLIQVRSREGKVVLDLTQEATV